MRGSDIAGPREAGRDPPSLTASGQVVVERDCSKRLLVPETGQKAWAATNILQRLYVIRNFALAASSASQLQLSFQTLSRSCASLKA